MSASPGDVAKVAGRGVLWIGAAKAWFMVAGWAIEFALPHLLSAALFGAWKITVGAVSVVNNTIVTGTIQTVSKFTSERDDNAAVARAALRLMAPLGLLVAGAYFVVSPWLAKFEHDASLLPYLRGTVPIIACYALYAVFIGVTNGQRRFHVQASLDISFSTLKATLVIAAAALGLSVGGAIGGFVVAALLILCASWLLIGAPAGAEGPSLRRLAVFWSQLVAYTLLLNLLLLVDLFLLKRFAAEAIGVIGGDSAEQASRVAGHYAAAQTLARIPYQGILSVAFVIFPLISRATFDRDHEATRHYVRTTMRFSLIFCAALAVVFEANPLAILRVPYPAEYASAGNVLALLAPAQLCFSLFSVACTVLNGAGHTRATLLLASATLAVLVGCCVASVRWLGPEYGVAWATAVAVLVANAGGVVSALFLLWRRFAARLPWATVFRVILCFTMVTAIGRAIPDGSKLATLIESFLVGGLFLGGLVALGELGREDRVALQRIFARQREPR